MEPFCRKTVQQAQEFSQEGDLNQAMKTLSTLRRCCTESDCANGANCIDLLDDEWTRLQKEFEK